MGSEKSTLDPIYIILFKLNWRGINVILYLVKVKHDMERKNCSGKGKDNDGCLKKNMEKKIEKLVSNVGKNAKNILEKSKNRAVQIVDQNEEGKFDLEDVSEMANSFGNIVRKSTQSLKEMVDERSQQIEFEKLKPIFLEDLNGFSIPRFIRITDRDKKYAESEACKGAIGFWLDFKKIRLMNIFRDSVDMCALSFYPNAESEFYYVNPIDRDNYIILDEYFDYLKQVRIGELQKIAQDLGAKHFKVTYKEEKMSFSDRKISNKIGVKAISDVNVEQKYEENKYSKTEIAAEMECPGHAPIEPVIKYMKYDPNIQRLVEMRMDSKSPLSHQALTIKLSNSSGLKESEAIKIDAVLKGLKCTGNSTVVNEVRNESRRYLEYEIDF